MMACLTLEGPIGTSITRLSQTPSSLGVKKEGIFKEVIS
jgi:hypothetical protein